MRQSRLRTFAKFRRKKERFHRPLSAGQGAVKSQVQNTIRKDRKPRSRSSKFAPIWPVFPKWHSCMVAPGKSVLTWSQSHFCRVRCGVFDRCCKSVTNSDAYSYTGLQAHQPSATFEVA